MKNQLAFVFLTLCFAFFSLFANAQNQPALKDIHNVSLPQLMKQKKEIRFVTEAGSHGAVIKWYEETKATNQAAATQPVSAGANTNFHLTKDINVQTDADPVNSNFIFNNPYAVVNGVLYFSANDGVHGNELWRSDGTETGTHLVKDLIAGSASSNPHEIITAGNKVYFVTQNNTLFSYALWVSDGTANGTTMLASFQRQGPGVNTAYNLTAVGNEVFYFTYGPFNEQLLWKTDGTTNGTVTVKDFTDITSGGPLGYTAAGNLFYFTLFSDVTGRELYRSDGTDAGTFLVKDISSGTDYFTGPVQLTAFNDKLYFTDDDGSGQKLWLTDGTTSGTRLAKDNNGITISTDYSYIFINAHFAVQGNNLYMSATAPSTGQELYRYNPATGFSLVKDITPGAAGGFPYNITPALGKIAFTYSDTLTKQTELWAVTETNHAKLIKSYPQPGASFDYLTPGNQLLYFVSRTTDTGLELWKTNGTAEGTLLVKDIYTGTTSSYPQDLTYVNNALYFNAASKKAGTELWQSGGNAADTKMVAEINKTATDYSGPDFYNGTAFNLSSFRGANSATAGKLLYFSATQPETGYEVYKSDGTSTGTTLAKDIFPGEFASNPVAFMSKNGFVYFTATTADSGYTYSNIYKADSSGNINPVSSAISGYILSYDVADNGWIYYIAYNYQMATYELRRTTGADTSSILLANNVSGGLNNSYSVRTIGNSAYFAASDEDGTELWKTNGSAAGTKRVKDINAGSNSASPYSLTVFKNNIYFGADDGSGNALWRSNGTAAGTVKLKAIQPYGIYSNTYDYPNYFCVVNDVLYLDATTAATGYELWKTNGTAGGTVLVKDLTNDASDANPTYLTNVNGTLFFNASVNQIWKSDGTANGTVLLASIPTTDYYLLSSRCVADGKFFFNANQLLWVSDGTEAGTHTVNDNGLNGVSLINNLVSSGSTIFCNGYTSKYSYELYTGDAALVAPFLISQNRIARKPASFSAAIGQNPVVGTLKMNVASDINQTVNITISNANGNVATQQKVTLYKGNNNVMINAGNWQTGVYLVKIQNAAGDVVSVRAFK